jgi:hypothetical protein
VNAGVGQYEATDMSRKTLIDRISFWPRRAWITQLLRQLLPVPDPGKLFVLPVSNSDDMVYHVKVSELPSYSISELAGLIRKFCTQKLPSETRMVRILDAGTNMGTVVGEGEILAFELTKQTQKAVVVEVVSQTLHVARIDPDVFKAGLCCQSLIGPPHPERGGR